MERIERILQMLESRMIPWAKSPNCALVAARVDMEATQLPSGTTLEHRPLRGPRKSVRNRRHFANHRLFSAEWPRANQQEMLFPKIACVVRGNADYLLGNHCLHAAEGTFIIIPPGVPHHNKGPFLDPPRQQHKGCTVLFAYAYSQGVYCWFSRSSEEGHVNDMADNYLIPSAVAVQILHLLADEAAAGEAGWEEICRGLLAPFYSVVAREVQNGRYIQAVEERNEVRSLSDEDFSSRVREHIRANLYKRLKVEDVARHVYMSASHFSRTLRHKTGKSFVDLLTECRLERARELLIDSDWTVNYIAGYVGFKSPAYFHEFFQRHMNCTPLEYRERHRDTT